MSLRWVGEKVARVSIHQSNKRTTRERTTRVDTTRDGVAKALQLWKATRASQCRHAPMV